MKTASGWPAALRPSRFELISTRTPGKGTQEAASKPEASSHTNGTTGDSFQVRVHTFFVVGACDPTLLFYKGGDGPQ